MKSRRMALFLICWMLAIPVAGFSWGRDGHRVVAKISAKNLSQDARKKVAAILGTNEAGVEATMAAAATWPDEISKPDTKTDKWHFVECTANLGGGHRG
ncbi:MAG TPA: S1/P1 nuclease [Terriglobia bacterium]|nr:S1/P1 nuclease [Terriglobia bacterium]